MPTDKFVKACCHPADEFGIFYSYLVKDLGSFNVIQGDKSFIFVTLIMDLRKDDQPQLLLIDPEIDDLYIPIQIFECLRQFVACKVDI